MKLTLEFDLPPTLNDMINLARTNKFKAALDKKEWTERIANESEGSIQFPSKVWMSFTWYLKNFGRDADNVQAAKKYILDGLQGLKPDKKSDIFIIPPVIIQDNLKVIQSPIIEWFEKSKEDRVIVLITDNPMDILKPCVDMYEELKQLVS